MMTEDAIKDILKGIEGFPAPVRDWIVETGEDWTGDPAVWVWAILDEKDLDRETRTAVRDAVWERLRTAFGLGVEKDAPWPFIRFRSVEEMKELQAFTCPSC